MSKPNLPPLQFPTSIGLGVVPPNKEQRRQEILALREPVTHNDAAFLRNSSSMPHGAQPYKPIKAVKKHCQRVKRKVDHKLKELARAIDLDEDADRPEEILDAAREKLLELEQRCKQMTEEAQRRGGVGSTSTESLAEDGDDGEGKSPRSSNNGGGMMTPTSPRSTNSVPTRSPRSSVRRGSPRSTNSLPAHLPSDIEAHILDDDFSDAASTTSSLHMSEEAEAKRKSLHARFQLLRESVGEQDTCMVKVLGTALTKLNQYQKRCKALEDEAKRLEQSNDNNNCNACRSKSFFAKFWRHRHSHPAPAATNAPPPPPPPPSAGRQSFYMPSQSAGPPPPVPPRPRQYSAMAGAPQYMFPQQPQQQPQSSMEIMDISDMDSELQHSTAQLNGLSLGQSNSNSSIPSSSSSSSQLHHQQQQQQHQQQQHQQQQYCGVPLSSSDSVMNGSATPGGSEGEGAAPIIREEVSYHSVFAQGVVAMAVTSLDGRFIDGNGEFMQLTGYTNQELKSLTIFSIMDSADMADMYTRIPAVVAGTQSRFDKVCTIAVKAGRGGDGGQLSPSSNRNNNNMRQSLCSPTLSQCVKDCKTRPLRVRIRGNVVKEPNNRFFLFVFTEVAQ